LNILIWALRIVDSRIFLQIQAMKALKQLSNNMYFMETFESLLEAMQNKTLLEVSFFTLIDLIQNIYKTGLENLSDWKLFFKLLHQIYYKNEKDQDRDLFQNKTILVVKAIKDKLGENELMILIKSNAKDNILKFMTEIVKICELDSLKNGTNN